MFSPIVALRHSAQTLHTLTGVAVGDSPGESQVRRAEELIEQSQHFEPRDLARVSGLDAY